jgi:acyl-CoA thioester hydrolase
VIIESETLDYNSKIGKVFQQMKNEKGDICAIAEFTIGLFDMQKRRLISPTDDWLRAVGVIE